MTLRTYTRPGALRAQGGAAILTAMLIVTLVASLSAAALWQHWRGVEVETAERGRLQSSWLLQGAQDWARLILREDARAGGTDRRFAALMEGQHAATLLRAPFDLQAKNRGFNQLATTRSTIGNYMGIVGAARRSWAANNDAQVVGLIRAYRDAIRRLKLPENRPQAQALLMKYVPNMNAQIAAQSCDLLLDQQSGFFSDVQLDDKGIQAVLDLRSNLGDNAKKLTDPSKYIDKRYWQKAMQP